MLTCKEVSRLLSAAQDRNLGFREQIALRLHLSLCSGCRNFSRQLHTLRKAARQLGNSEEEANGSN